MKSDDQHDDGAGRAKGLQTRAPVETPVFEFWLGKKRAVSQWNCPERLPRGEVENELLNRAFQTQIKSDNSDYQRNRQPEENRVTHIVQKHVTSVEIYGTSVEDEG